ncbi:MAG: cupin domain-containing protein [Ruminococcaceae bacterium]|nr:cupin domain-containing protein [Oscillospiraceae bacterium]
MIKRNNNMTTDIKVQMRGGNGQAVIKNVLDKGEYKGASRLVATITLEPGCSIGAHIHENEEEIFYIIKGTATYNDNGKTETLHAGDSCVCLSGQEHSISNETENETLEVFAVILTY